MGVGLKQYRSQFRITQQVLAEKIGVSQQTVARWESGTSHIPSKYLKDLAVLFGGQVADFVEGAAGVGEKVVAIRPSATASSDEDDLAWGGAMLRFCVVKPGDDESAAYSYPITGGEYNRLFEALHCLGDAGDESDGLWIEFKTLDNRWVIVNTAHLSGVTMLSDAVEMMPTYEHDEVYKAARKILMGDLPNSDSTADDDYPYSENLMQSARDFIEEVGNVDSAFTRIDGIAYETATGVRYGCAADDDALGALHDTFELCSDHAAPNRFVDIGPEGQRHKSTFVRLGSLRLIEVSLLRLSDFLSQ